MRSKQRSAVMVVVVIGVLAAGQAISGRATAAGSKIAFTRCTGGDCDIWRMASDGSGKQRVIHLPGVQLAPKYSPEGRTLVFESAHRGGVSSIYRVNESGTGLYRLTAGATDRTPVFSPDGNRIAFSRTLDGKTHIWTMTAAGGSPTQLTKDDSAHTDPTWSSDGRSLLYVSDTGPGRDIYVGYLNSTRTAISQIGRLTSVGSNVAPDYLGCGGTSTPPQKVVFSSNRSGNFELYDMDPNGNNIRRITDHAGVDGTPTWAPQGGPTNLVLAYVSDRAGDQTRKIFVRRASRFGYSDTNVSGTGSASDFTPDFWGSDVCPMQASTG